MKKLISIKIFKKLWNKILETEVNRKDDIKKFKDFLDSCYESFDSSINVNFLSKNNSLWKGEFKFEGLSYEILIKRLDDIKDSKIYSVKFYEIKDESKIFIKSEEDNLKRSLSVLGTVNKTLLEFIEKENPTVLFFYTSDSNEARSKLYSNFSKRISNKFDYYSFEYEMDDITFYFICQNNYNINNLKQYFKLIYNFI